jgi:hypothetical protein
MLTFPFFFFFFFFFFFINLNFWKKANLSYMDLTSSLGEFLACQTYETERMQDNEHMEISFSLSEMS